MRKRVKEYVHLPYSTFVVPDVTTNDEPCYVAYHPELEGCMSHGDTPEEALDNLAEVTELYISELLDRGLQVPVPQGTEVTWAIVIPTSEVEADISILPSIASPIFASVS